MNKVKLKSIEQIMNCKDRVQIVTVDASGIGNQERRHIVDDESISERMYKKLMDAGAVEQVIRVVWEVKPITDDKENQND